MGKNISKIFKNKEKIIQDEMLRSSKRAINNVNNNDKKENIYQNFVKMKYDNKIENKEIEISQEDIDFIKKYEENPEEAEKFLIEKNKENIKNLNREKMLIEEMSKLKDFDKNKDSVLTGKRDISSEFEKKNGENYSRPNRKYSEKSFEKLKDDFEQKKKEIPEEEDADFMKALFELTEKMKLQSKIIKQDTSQVNIIQKKYANEKDRFNPLNKIEGKISSKEFSSFFEKLNLIDDDSKMEEIIKLSTDNNIEKMKIRKIVKYFNTVNVIKIDDDFVGLWKKPNKAIYLKMKI
jgi:hypothetical protein